MSHYPSGYAPLDYRSSYSSVESACDGCPGTDDMQTTWDAIAYSSPTISTSGTVLPDYIVITMYTGGPAPGNAGSWVFDANDKTVTKTTQNIMTGEPETTVYPVSDACVQTCRDTFDYWYNL